MTYFNPCPKPKTERLNGKAYTELKLKAYKRDGQCCTECGKWLPLLDSDGAFDIFTCAHLAHGKSHGAGGPDTLDNVRIKCYDCHINVEHTRGIK